MTAAVALTTLLNAFAEWHHREKFQIAFLLPAWNLLALGLENLLHLNDRVLDTGAQLSLPVTCAIRGLRHMAWLAAVGAVVRSTVLLVQFEAEAALRFFALLASKLERAETALLRNRYAVGDFREWNL